MHNKPFPNKYTKATPFIPKIGSTSMSTTIQVKPNERSLPIFKRLSPIERKERISKGLSFNYEDKFVPCHKYKGRMLKNCHQMNPAFGN